MQTGGEGAPPSGGGGRANQRSHNRDELKAYRKLTSIIRAATEIKL